MFWYSTHLMSTSCFEVKTTCSFIVEEASIYVMSEEGMRVKKKLFGVMTVLYSDLCSQVEIDHPLFAIQ